MDISADSLQDQIPYYLTREQKDGLLKAIKDFPRNASYYLAGQSAEEYRETLLQGDGWTKLQVINFYTGEKAKIAGVVLSNTCDVSPDNQRDFPPNVVFAPLVPLAAYNEALNGKVDPDKVRQKIAAIKAQGVTSIFYLPAGSGLKEDYIVLLDDVHTVPAAAFTEEAERTKLFTLDQFGFYLFVFKLSIHWCRLQECLNRA